MSHQVSHCSVSSVFPECRATVVALYDGHRLVSEVSEGQRCGVILDHTCFYSERGGQSHDRGYLTLDDLQVRRSSRR